MPRWSGSGVHVYPWKRRYVSNQTSEAVGGFVREDSSVIDAKSSAGFRR